MKCQPYVFFILHLTLINQKLVWSSNVLNSSWLVCGNEDLEQASVIDGSVVGGYTMRFLNQYLDHVIDILPNIFYNVLISHETPLKQISAFQFSVKSSNITDVTVTNMADWFVLGVDCDTRVIPMNITFALKSEIRTCITLSMKISDDSAIYIVSKKICTPPDSRKYFETNNFTEITSPMYPGNYGDNMNCTYIIYTTTRMPLYLKFQKFDLEPPYEHTCYDFVIIQTENYKSGKLCGSKKASELLDINILSKKGQISIEFISDGKFVKTGFKAVAYAMYESGCNSTVHDMNGTLSNLDFPGIYQRGDKCSVYIRVPDNYLVMLLFDYNNIISENGTLCDGGYISITSILNNSTTVTHGKFCDENSKSSSVIYSRSSIVLIQIVTLETNKNNEFMLRYYGIQKCKNVTFSKDNGSIRSLNFPQNYLNNQECFYVIKVVTDNTAVELLFKELYTESRDDKFGEGPFCTLDFVEVYTDKGVYRLCGYLKGNRKSQKYVSLSGTIVIRFFSNEIIGKRGFYAVWRAVSKISVYNSCDQSLETPNYRFEIIRDPMSWENGNKECRSKGGVLAIINDARLQLLLESFLKQSENCTFPEDSFWIGATDRKKEREFTWADGERLEFNNWFPGWMLYNNANRQPSDDGFSDEDCIEIRRTYYYPEKGMGFTKNYYWNDRDCDAKNPYICQQPKNAVTFPASPLINMCDDVHELNTVTRNVVINNPGFPEAYVDFLNCSIIVKAPVGYILDFNFLHFSLEYENRCRFDSLTISSVPTNKDAVIYCGHRNDELNEMHWKSQTNVVLLRLISDHSKTSTGFSINVTAISAFKFSDQKNCTTYPNCHTMYVEEPDVFDNAYSHCLLNNMTILQSFKDTDLFNLVQFLATIVDDSKISIWGRKMSQTENPMLEYSCHAVNIYPRSRNVYVDFDVVNVTVPCTSRLNYFCRKTKENIPTTKVFINKSSGTLDYPSTGNRRLFYENNEHYTIVLKANIGYKILLTILWTDIEYHAECTYDYLLISDLKANHRFCGYNESLSFHFLSNSNLINLLFRSDDSIVAKGFSISWRFLRYFECIENIYKGGIGTVKSVTDYMFPANKYNCCTVISAPEFSSRILLRLHYFSTVCNISFLQIFDGNKSIAKLCSANLTVNRSTIFLSTGFRMKLCFVSRTRGDEFSGNYTFVSSSERAIVQEYIKINPQISQDGRITSLHYPSTAPRNLIHTITLRAPIGFRVMLNITDINCSRIMNSHEHYLEIYDDSPFMTFAMLIGNISCNILNFTDKYSSYTNRLVLVFYTGSTGDSHVYFTADYHAEKDNLLLSRTADAPSNFSFDECVNNKTCINGGECVEMSEHNFVCHCSSEYTGLFCQRPSCEMPRCGQEVCNNTTELLTCDCDDDAWGPVCNNSFSECGAYFCSGRGLCSGEKRKHPKCSCFLGWKGREFFYTCVCGSQCSVSADVPLILIGERLLREPIWVGMIVILSLLFLFGVLFVLKKKCGRYFTFCKDTMEMLRHREDGIPAHRNDPISQSPSLNRRPSFAAYVASSQAFCIDKNCTAGVEDDTSVETPTITLTNKEAAARLFDSLKFHAVFPFEKQSKAMEFNSSPVGGLIEGTLAFATSDRDNSVFNSPSVFSKRKLYSQSLTEARPYDTHMNTCAGTSLNTLRAHTIAVDDPSARQSFNDMHYFLQETPIMDSRIEPKPDTKNFSNRKPAISSPMCLEHCSQDKFSFHSLNVLDKRKVFASKDKSEFYHGKCDGVIPTHVQSDDDIMFISLSEESNVDAKNFVSLDLNINSKRRFSELSYTERMSDSELDRYHYLTEFSTMENTSDVETEYGLPNLAKLHEVHQQSRKKHRHYTRVPKNKLYHESHISCGPLSSTNSITGEKYHDSSKQRHRRMKKNSGLNKQTKQPSFCSNKNRAPSENVSSIELEECHISSISRQEMNSPKSTLKKLFESVDQEVVTEGNVSEESSCIDRKQTLVKRQNPSEVQNRKSRAKMTSDSGQGLSNRENMSMTPNNNHADEMISESQSPMFCIEMESNDIESLSNSIVKDSAYQTTQSSLEAACLIDSSTDKHSNQYNNRYMDINVHRQLKQAALKLATLKARGTRPHEMSKDSAIHITTENDSDSDVSIKDPPSSKKMNCTGFVNNSFVLEQVSEEGNPLQNQESSIVQAKEFSCETNRGKINVDTTSFSKQEQIEMTEYIV